MLRLPTISHTEKRRKQSKFHDQSDNSTQASFTDLLLHIQVMIQMTVGWQWQLRFLLHRNSVCILRQMEKIVR